MILLALHTVQHQFHLHLEWLLPKDLSNDKNNVVAVIGDGAMSAGMAYEAMNNAGAMKSKLIVILNDNDMSIAPPGAMSKYLARLLSGKFVSSLRETIKLILSAFSKRFSKSAGKAEDMLQKYCNRRNAF